MIARIALPVGIHTLGPSDGTVQVKTYREGMAQAVGHDLVLDVTEWHATVSVAGDGTPSIEFEVDPRSLQVREGVRGVKPLSDKDRADIVKNINDKILQGKPISFRSKSATAGDGSTVAVTGDLTLCGTTRQEKFALQSGDGRMAGTLSVTQSDYGIKPYRAMLGALKVRDGVEIVIDVPLPG
jgi:polyisoprenoid-binding protein YceI